MSHGSPEDNKRIERPAFSLDPRQDRLIENPGGRFSMRSLISAKSTQVIRVVDDPATIIPELPEIDPMRDLSPIIGLTFAKVEILTGENNEKPEPTNNATEEAELFEPDLIFFYKGGKLPVFGGNSDDFYRLLKNRPLVLVLRIRKDLQIPDAWVSELRTLRSEYPQFSFVRLQDNGSDDSIAEFFIDGERQDEEIPLAHTRQICLSADALADRLMPVIFKYENNVRKITSDVQKETHTASVVTDLAVVTPAPSPKPKMTIDQLERQWAKRSGDIHTLKLD